MLFENIGSAYGLSGNWFDYGGTGGVSSVTLRTDLQLAWLLYKYRHSVDDSGRSPLSHRIRHWLKLSVQWLQCIPTQGDFAVTAHFDGRVSPDLLQLDRDTGVIHGWSGVVASQSFYKR
eukprot:3216697-Pyramimonas_sp.AAC.1